MKVYEKRMKAYEKHMKSIWKGYEKRIKAYKSVYENVVKDIDQCAVLHGTEFVTCNSSWILGNFDRMGVLEKTNTITKLCNPMLHFSDWKSM